MSRCLPMLHLPRSSRCPPPPPAPRCPPLRAPASKRGVPRLESRLPAILDATARLFREKGYTVTSMRDIAAASGMLAGSLYYHFESKDELLVAVYAEGVRRISASVRAALDRDLPPWTRLEAVCAAHLAALLEDSDYAQVVIRVRPDDAPGAAGRLVALRDDYERLFAEALQKLPLRPAHRPPRAAPHAARRAQLVADVVSLGARRPRGHRAPVRGPVAPPARTLIAAAAASTGATPTWISVPKSSSPRSASMATTAAAASSPRTCATRAWRSSTRRRGRPFPRSSNSRSKKTSM